MAIHKLPLDGAILAIGKRTVTSCLRMVGLAHEMAFQNYHRVLNGARWSALAASLLLLRLLIAAFALNGQVVCGQDGTIQRQRGQQIYRDAVRSTRTLLMPAACAD